MHNLSDSIALILAIGLYLVFMMAVGLHFYGKSRTTTEYFLGGRKLGAWVTSMSAQASDMSGWLMLGLPGAAYVSGLSASWIAIGLAVGTYLNWRCVAKPLRQYTKVAGDAITLPQFFSNRYRDKRGILNLIASVFILVFYLVYTASGFVSAAKLFNTVFGIPYIAALLLGVVVVVGYTFGGGFFAVCWTDFFQGLLMFFAILAVPIVAILALGGPAETFHLTLNLHPDFLQLFTDGKTHTQLGVMDIVSLAAWGLGYFGQTHILVRFMGIDSPASLKKSRHIAMVWVILSLGAAILIGISGNLYLQQFLHQDLGATGAQETVYITMVQTVFPTFIGGILLSAILAAIMSTSSSQLLVTASALTEDFYHAKLRPNATAKEQMWVSRFCIIGVSVVACLLSLNQSSSVLDLVQYAWAGFGATFGPLVLCSLFWRRANLQGALAGIVVGGVVDIVWSQLSGGIFDLYEIVPGFLCSLLAIVVVSLLTPPPSEEITKEFDEYRNCND